MEKEFHNYIINDSGDNYKTVYSIFSKKYMKPSKNTKGYYYLNLRINNKTIRFLLHRLIAKLFIPNPDNKPFIDHINGCKTDNKVENLRWCTYSENNNNPITKERQSKVTNRKNVSKKVYQYTLDGELVKIWPSTRETDRNGFCGNKIACCCRGLKKYKTHKGYRWSYEPL